MSEPKKIPTAFEINWQDSIGEEYSLVVPADVSALFEATRKYAFGEILVHHTQETFKRLVELKKRLMDYVGFKLREDECFKNPGWRIAFWRQTVRDFEQHFTTIADQVNTVKIGMDLIHTARGNLQNGLQLALEASKIQIILPWTTDRKESKLSIRNTREALQAKLAELDTDELNLLSLIGALMGWIQTYSEYVPKAAYYYAVGEDDEGAMADEILLKADGTITHFSRLMKARADELGRELVGPESITAITLEPYCGAIYMKVDSLKV